MGKIHKGAQRAHFDKHGDDLRLIQPFLAGFDVSRAQVVTRGGDKLHVFHLVAEEFMSQLLGVEREVILSYAPFPKFQIRTLTLHDEQLANARADRFLSIIVSDDPGTRNAIRNVLASEPERPTIIGLSRSELEKISGADELRTALLQQAFRRDLFAVESPLQTELLFFGRSPLRDDLINRFRSGQNTGLFGLRRIGKTSILYALKRHLETTRDGHAAYLDLSNPSRYGARWWELLQVFVKELAAPFKLERGERSKILALSAEYLEGNAADFFRRDIERLRQYAPGQRILLLLDEIENITFRIGPAPHWNADFLPFVQTLRATHQELNGAFCFVLCGVNPHLLEKPQIDKFDNPLFATVRAVYVPPLDFKATREMIRRIGRYMGLRFDEELMRQLVEDYGGHPFLIRQACSLLAGKVDKERPADVGLAHFSRISKTIERKLDKIARQILQVLSLWYPDEYELLRMLAQGHAMEFVEHAREVPDFVEHVEGYGLVEDAADNPKIKIGLVAAHLKKAESPTLTTELPAKPADVLSEISRKRNTLEKGLRRLLHQALLIGYGNKAAHEVLKGFGEKRRQTLAQFSFGDLWEETYFDELVTCVDKNWPTLQNLFGCDKDVVLRQLAHINKYRADAHARAIGEEELAYLRLAFKELGKVLGQFG